MSELQPPLPVRPGSGVDVARLPIGDVTAELRAGTYVLDSEFEVEIDAVSQRVQADGVEAVGQETIRALLFADAPKTFRNALSTVVIEQAWPGYSTAVSGENPGLFGIAVTENGRTSLVPMPDTPAGKTAAEIATCIADSNQQTLSHFICREFADGRTPVVSGDRETDAYYTKLLDAQTGLLSVLDSQFRTLPRAVGDSAVFVASGTITLKTQVFGLPNLLDALADRGGFSLTNEQHRRGFENTMLRSVTPYYLPTSRISVGVNDQVVDHATLALLPDRWRHNNNPDCFVAYPDPSIVDEVNRTVEADRAQGKGVANATGCPAFYCRIQQPPETSAPVLPLPRSLIEIGLRQLDRWYYPNRSEPERKMA
jgi:hypothetical protein